MGGFQMYMDGNLVAELNGNSSFAVASSPSSPRIVAGDPLQVTIIVHQRCY